MARIRTGELRIIWQARVRLAVFRVVKQAGKDQYQDIQVGLYTQELPKLDLTNGNHFPFKVHLNTFDIITPACKTRKCAP